MNNKPADPELTAREPTLVKRLELECPGFLTDVVKVIDEVAVVSKA